MLAQLVKIVYMIVYQGMREELFHSGQEFTVKTNTTNYSNEKKLTGLLTMLGEEMFNALGDERAHGT